MILPYFSRLGGSKASVRDSHMPSVSVYFIYKSLFPKDLNPQYGRALRKFYKVQSAVHSLN